LASKLCDEVDKLIVNLIHVMIVNFKFTWPNGEFNPIWHGTTQLNYLKVPKVATPEIKCQSFVAATKSRKVVTSPKATAPRK